jgi:hypothetical protein
VNVGWALVFFASGAALLFYGLRLVRDARSCARWPRAEGRILTSAVSVVSRQKDKRWYAPSVSYFYTVAGQRHQGARLTLVPRNYTLQSQANAAISRYPAGSPVHVFHDPRDPTSCVLEARTTGTEWAYPLGGLLLMAAGLLFLLPG